MSEYLKGTAPYSGKADSFATANVPTPIPSNPRPYEGGAPGDPIIVGPSWGSAQHGGTRSFSAQGSEPGLAKVDGTV